MTTFWIVTALAVLAVSAPLLLALLRARTEIAGAEAFDLKVYRDQLSEIDRDRARGTIGEAEAERLRTEVSRRILAADSRAHQPGTGRVGRGPRRVAAVLVLLALLGGSYALYLRLGAPGYGDLSLGTRISAAEELRATRPSQAEAEAAVSEAPPSQAPAEYMQLVTRLREAVASRPDDLQGQALLARSEAALGNYRAAYAAQRQVITLRGDGASAADFADLADMMVLAAGGYVSPEAEAALDEVMARDPHNGVARYYGGLMMAQTGRPDSAFRIWDSLLRQSEPGAPWIPAIAGQMPELARRAGVNDYALPEIASAALKGEVPPALPGPSTEDMQAASEMSDTDRQAMIEGMVDNLSERLASQGGSPEEWARLLTALGVLGQTDRAAAIWTEAQQVFASRPEALDTVRDGAARAGLVTD
ncbi:c-type cytochrome biogenesis protein CcmI [Salipiger mangrovisoli]|uniref:C-type cytochrome biogenesis protein CcmI n=1 Tax=Salipiger mangrovisoli TaxID=2865933 RepID=A0ABR9X3F4_9RHOB|nr:c-type cytochrome biogenesis protein CcmI [Salipiger mangrovisoli]MBE9638115.1 c-type cytochrome biogenesis protein CcmI [Salipiger mangrovisoli]